MKWIEFLLRKGIKGALTTIVGGAVYYTTQRPELALIAGAVWHALKDALITAWQKQDPTQT
jgi:hypothetical protein